MKPPSTPKISEATIERKACEYAKRTGFLVYKFTSPNHRGVPDRMFLFNGRALFIEFKRKGGKTTALQERELRVLRENGFTAEVADSLDKAICILEKFRNEQPVYIRRNPGVW